MRNAFLVLGSLVCAVAIAAGAFGAHGLRARLDARALELWETAARYLMYSGLGLLLVGVASGRWDRALLGVAGWTLFAGAAIFSGTVAALALGGPRWLGAVTPIGGVLMIAGFLFVAWAALKL